MRNYVTQHDSCGNEIVLTMDDLLRRVHSFNKDPRIQDWELKIVLTGGSESYSFHVILVGYDFKVPFQVYASCDWGLRGYSDLSQEENTMYHQAWNVWCQKGLNRALFNF